MLDAGLVPRAPAAPVLGLALTLQIERRMTTRRTFLRASVAALLTSAAAAAARAQSHGHQVYLPYAQRPLPPTVVPGPTPGIDRCGPPWPQPTPDAPIIGPARGTVEQAVAWFVPRASVIPPPAGYTEYDVRVICEAYRSIGESVGVDWFTALAQMAHETGSLTSWWCQRPRRNPAGIGVTGATRPGTEPQPGPHWAWDDRSLIWREGVSFPDWVQESIPAHLGRLLAYALRDEEANEEQRKLIAHALSYRPLTTYRGTARTWQGLNSKWAYPGCTYGQSILNLASRMRGEITTADMPPSGAEDGDWMPADG